jgi:hypothetical protein
MGASVPPLGLRKGAVRIEYKKGKNIPGIY